MGPDRGRVHADDRPVDLSDGVGVLLDVGQKTVPGAVGYAEVPARDWVRDWLGLERNPYDRFGHLMQGLVPAVLVRELLVRTSPLRGSRWLAPLAVCACLAFSAVFEMLEWAAAVIGGQAADAFLATQGDVWDTQWDMFCALIGATCSLMLLSRLHDRSLSRLTPSLKNRTGPDAVDRCPGAGEGAR